MAWTATRTWVAGEVLTAALMNEQVRDNLAFEHDAPSVHMRRTADQTGVVTATWTAISWDTVMRNAHAMWNASFPTRVTVPIDGTYNAGFHNDWPGNATGSRGQRFLVNGATSFHSTILSANGSSAWRAFATRRLRLSAGQYVEFQAYQSSGGNLTLNGGEVTEGWLEWVAPL